MAHLYNFLWRIYYYVLRFLVRLQYNYFLKLLWYNYLSLFIWYDTNDTFTRIENNSYFFRTFLKAPVKITWLNNTLSCLFTKQLAYSIYLSDTVSSALIHIWAVSSSSWVSISVFTSSSGSTSSEFIKPLSSYLVQQKCKIFRVGFAFCFRTDCSCKRNSNCKKISYCK